jgi:hypothetical protein
MKEREPTEKDIPYTYGVVMVVLQVWERGSRLEATKREVML